MVRRRTIDLQAELGFAVRVATMTKMRAHSWLAPQHDKFKFSLARIVFTIQDL